MFDNENSTKIFIGGLITGGVIGGLTALIFAPKSGREFRRDISDKGNELLDDTEMLIEDAKSKASKILKDAKKTAEELIKDAGEKVEKLSHNTENLISQSRNKLEDNVSRIKEAVKTGVEAYNDDSNRTIKKQ
ncbi:MAG TPA: YtxH domain-containing protein [Ignavibacteria bacterium]|nr:YtxH domain-containing protein [Ignavibacteria bacterium]HMR40255.1 YtxH domain-containing protein [Ignavibacteria bacterium]